MCSTDVNSGKSRKLIAKTKTLLFNLTPKLHVHTAQINYTTIPWTTALGFSLIMNFRCLNKTVSRQDIFYKQFHGTAQLLAASQ